MKRQQEFVTMSSLFALSNSLPRAPLKLIAAVAADEASARIRYHELVIRVTNSLPRAPLTLIAHSLHD